MVCLSLTNIGMYREKITLLHCEISANYIDCSVSNWCTANTKPNPNNNPNPNTNTKPLSYHTLTLILLTVTLTVINAALTKRVQSNSVLCRHEAFYYY